MKRLKQIGLYCALICILGLALWIAAPAFWEDTVLSAVSGKQDITYAQIALNDNSTVYAVGCQGDNWLLTRAGSQGPEQHLSLAELGITDIHSAGPLHVCSDGGVIMTFTEQKEALLYRLYYIAPGEKKAQMILSTPQREGFGGDVRLLGFAEEAGAVAFLLEQQDECTAYCFYPENGTAQKLSTFTGRQAESALYMLPSGSSAKLEGQSLQIGRITIDLPQELTPGAIWVRGNKLCLLDRAEAALWRIDTLTGDWDLLLNLEEDVPGVAAVGVASNRVLLLTEDGCLLLQQADSLSDCSSLLYRQQWKSWLFLGLGIVGVLLAALLLWYLLWEKRRMQLPLLIRYGTAVAAVLALLTAASIRLLLQPHYLAQADALARTALSTAAVSSPDPLVDTSGGILESDDFPATRAEYVYALWQAFGSPQVTVSYLFEDIDPQSSYLTAAEWAASCRILTGTAQTFFYPDELLTGEEALTLLYRAMQNLGSSRMTLEKNASSFYCTEKNGSKTALSSLMLGNRFRSAVEDTLENGSAFLRFRTDGAWQYAFFAREGESSVSVMITEADSYLKAASQSAADTARILWIIAAVILVLMLVILATLSQGLRRVTRGMSAIQNGSYVRVSDRGGDEVGAMAATLNTMAQTMRETAASQLRRSDVYARFMPNQIADLLGAESIDAIDKQTFCSRTMATMHVSFSFDERVYESRSRELFDNINEITECTAKLVSAQGGIILSFSHDGFDALFEPDSSAPVSTAVAIRQAIISMNREHSRRNLSPVTLRITLDIGEVMLGVVGDENRMQAAAVSSSFNTARMLDALFTRFDANILCTERIHHWANEYGSRYIGKTHDGAELIRVYEIYDGDPFLVRRGKAESEKLFSEGVYTLYTGEYTAAKRIFMEVVRANNGDGAAKYYLYLADRFEQDPPEEVCLDC